MQPDLIAYELRTGAALRTAAARLAALPAAAPGDALLAALGLGGGRHHGEPARVARRAPPEVALARSIEAWGFAAGIREVAFVTVAPDRVEATLAQFPGAHVEHRARQVEIGAQDRWRDDRARGAPRVELYVARDPARARRAAALQADDPTRHAAELGALLGYPPCCVAAFVAQRTRHDNSLNRYLVAARTPAGDTPWPWQLNELHLRLIAFYPCSYRCPAAAAVAQATIDAIAAAAPAVAARLADALRATVLYVDHDHQLWLGDAHGSATIRYGAVAAVGDGRALPGLAALAEAADTLDVDDATLRLRAGDRPIAALARADGPGGLVARFG